jgi:hypothetical protein
MICRQTPWLRRLLLVALFTTTVQTAGECLTVEGVAHQWVVRLEVTACQSVEAAVEERIGPRPPRWVQRFLAETARRDPGVVLTGRVVERLPVERRGMTEYAVLGSIEVIEGAEAEVFFLAGGGTCDEWAAGTLAPLYRTTPCCCVTPPSGVACSLDLGELQAVPPELSAVAGLPQP